MSPDLRDAPREQPDDLSLALSEDMLAAEYVLGTLDADERKDTQDRIASDPAFAALVRLWERRLGELHVLTADMEPPAALWDAIKEKLAGIAPSETVRLPDPTPPQPAPTAARSPERPGPAGAGRAMAHHRRIHGIARGGAARLHPPAEMGAAAARALAQARRASLKASRAQARGRTTSRCWSATPSRPPSCSSSMPPRTALRCAASARRASSARATSCG